MSKWRSVGIITLVSVCGAAFADERPRAEESSHAVEQPSPAAVLTSQLCKIDIKGEKKDQWMRLPKPESSVTQHRFGVGGKSFDSTATAGTLIIRDDEDKPIASIGYVAYVRHDLKGGGARPLMFAFNGGPGSSSLWLNMGVLGPKRVAVSDPGPTPAGPYRTVDNEFGVLDKSDLVTIDPVGTGLSHAVCDHKDNEFWAVDPDVDSISRFITQYVSDNNRWTSPKYLLGESYGTTRGAAIVNYLRGRRSFAFNGLILVSVATDPEAIFAELPGNDRPYSVYLPGYAAVAWYHHMLPNQPAALEPFLTEVRTFAAGPFTAALLKGDALSEAEREAVVEKMHEYTGLSVDYLKAANLRVSEVAFAHELLKAQRKTVGRLDGRFVGPTTDPLEKYSDYDPQSAAIGSAPWEIGAKATGRSARAAALAFSRASVSRFSHVGAAAKPSSMTISSGPLAPPAATSARRIGPAIARMTSAAINRRSSSSGHGVRNAVVSLGLRPSSRRTGGNNCRRGRGGVTRSSQ